MKLSIKNKNLIIPYLFFFLMMGLLMIHSVRSLPVTAGLLPQGNKALEKWSVSEHLKQQGEGNLYRVIGNQSGSYLELAAGEQGILTYTLQETADEAAVADWRLRFLSMQGIGRIIVEALDGNGRVVGTVGWVITGPLPAGNNHTKWLDMRTIYNYKGHWLEQKITVAHFLEQYLPKTVLKSAKIYRLRVETGHGQHALIQRMNMSFDTNKAVSLRTVLKRSNLIIGNETEVETTVQNTGSRSLKNVNVKLMEPYGFGLVCIGPATQTMNHLAPGEIRRQVWKIRAQRPDTVNMGKPWALRFSVNDGPPVGQAYIQVTDNRPGKIFYVMTEDLEVIDAAGYPKAWGGQSGWLTPQEFQVQLINKAEGLDHIADRYGAKWTHFIAWPIVKGAEWAAAQSTTGKWPQVIHELEQAVKEQAAAGHEFDIHMHSDYDPYLDGNVLSYDPKTDGFWGNHLKHGWAHSVLTEGNFNDYQSRTGILYAYKSIIDRLTEDSPEGQSLVSRAGSFDFGSGAADEAESVRAYRHVGLWGSSDADGNIGGLTSAVYGKEIYFTKPNDIDHAATNIHRLGLVEIRPTPRRCIAYDHQSAAVMDRKADEGMAYFTKDGTVKAGVHAIVGFTHAMFVMGNGGWQSTKGGQFAQLDAHLAYLRHTYVDKGLLHFATAGEAVKAYLDYYSPRLLAVYGRKIYDEWGVAQYEIDLLGKDIPADSSHVQQVSVKYPLYLRDSAYRIVILKNGQPIYSTWGLPTPYNDINFTVDDKTAVYTMKVYHNPLLLKTVSFIKKLKNI
jgi:hypothetical protein